MHETKKKGYMAIELYMSKVYDRVEWNFLEEVMRRMGFANRWISLTMTCVRTVTYSMLINGQPYGKITSTLGLRQGDLRSPYFFISCAKGLSTTLNREDREGKITRLAISRGGMKLNHMFFADDSLLFCKANIP
jgi:hypothetical protein